MIRPDFRDYKGRGVEELMHSAKGTTWKNHKYIKKVNGRYIYQSSFRLSKQLGVRLTGTSIASKMKGAVDKSTQEPKDDAQKLQEQYDAAKNALEKMRNNSKNSRYTRPRDILVNMEKIKKQEKHVKELANELNEALLKKYNRK